MRHSVRPIALVLALVFVPTAFAQDKNTDKDKANLVKCEKAYKAAKTVLAKKPKDAAVKKHAGAATAAYGTAVMMTQTMPPKQKYSGALHLYREALTYDPKNKEALDNKKMIEDIYKSMGRPIPK